MLRIVHQNAPSERMSDRADYVTRFPKMLRAFGLALLLACSSVLAQAQDSAPAPTAQLAANAQNPGLRADWRQALEHMRKGAPRAALPILERLVTDFPAIARFRLELARALYLIEDDDRARYHFEYALSGDLSLGEIKAVQDYLSAMDTRKSWRGQARIAVVPQSNPWQRSGQPFVEIGGTLLLPLPQVERATGVELGLGMTWMPRLKQDLHARVHLVGTGQFFEEPDFTRGHLRGEFGFVWFGDHGRRLEMGITLQGAGGHDGVIMRGAGVQTVFQRRFGRRTQVTARASYDELRYARVSDYNGPRGAMSLGVQHILSPRLKISGALNLSHHHTQAEFHRRTDASVTLGTEISFGGGLITGLEANLGHISFGAANPLLPQFGAQRDWRAELSATMMHRNLSVYGFAPIVRVGVERSDSNIPMRSYDNLKVSLGATRNF